MFEINKKFVSGFGVVLLVVSIFLTYYFKDFLKVYFISLTIPITLIALSLVYIFIPKNKIKKLINSSVILVVLILLFNLILYVTTTLSIMNVGLGVYILLLIISTIGLVVSLLMAVISLFINKQKK